MRGFILMLMFIGLYHGIVHSQKPANQNATGIAGTIYDDKNNPLSGASVSVENSKRNTVTSVTGDFVLVLAPGTYSLRISYVGFEPKLITDIVVVQGKQTDVAINLSASTANTLNEVVVSTSAKKESANSLLKAQKNNASMTDGISAEQMKSLPDLTTAQTLTRVSGVNVQGGKFVTIRGVSDRYNNVMINGSLLPSTEPNRRNFSMDILPTSLVGNVVVNKTASPDLPGDFTGGMVQIATKDVPSKNFIEIALGTGINTGSVGKQMISFERSSRAYLGGVDKDRYWFGQGRPFDAFTFFRNFNQGDTAYTRNVSRAIPNRWKYFNYLYTPVQNYQLSGGFAKRFSDTKSIGFIGAVTYLNDQFIEAGDARSISNYDYGATRYKFNTTIGSLFNVTYKSKQFRLSSKNLFNVRYTHQVDDRQGNNISQQNIQRRFSDVLFQSELFQTRLEGEYFLPVNNLKLDFYGDYIVFDREQPDTRYLTTFFPKYGFDLAQLTLDYGGLFASVFKEKRNNAGMNLKIPFTVKGAKQTLKLGYDYFRRAADFENTGLRIRTPNRNAITNVGFIPYHEIITTDRFNNGDLVYSPAYSNSSSTGDTYSGLQVIHAPYAMVDLKVFEKLRIIGGLRYEANNMDITTSLYLFNNGNTENTDTTNTFNDSELLPSVNLVYSFNNKLNLRGAASKTVARPDFVERSFIFYYDFSDQLIVQGDVALKQTVVNNYDLRLEYYPAAGEILSASLFYKQFTNPVERFFELGNPSNFIRYNNQPSATAYGAEFDLRKNLGFLAKGSKLMERFFANANLTILSGTITTSDNIVLNRPIQGLSPYIVNAGLAYQQSRWGANIAFNRSGRKIVNAGAVTATVQFENPRSVLDVQLNTKLFKDKVDLRLNFNDLLNQYFIIYSNFNDPGVVDPRGDRLNEQYDFVNYKVKRGVNILFLATIKL
jgi:outer membrane receptor protein involved in Fe transport